MAVRWLRFPITLAILATTLAFAWQGPFTTTTALTGQRCLVAALGLLPHPTRLFPSTFIDSRIRATALDCMLTHSLAGSVLFLITAPRIWLPFGFQVLGVLHGVWSHEHTLVLNPTYAGETQDIPAADQMR